ncbi:MAG: aminoacyl-tRNA hydrolase [Candidatus Aminicenantales bacterium]
MVGLGNPGRRYSKTRHNVGFMFIQQMARAWKVKVRRRKHLSKTVTVENDQRPVILVMPQTFMNRSGIAVRELLQNTGIKPECLVVVYDDIDLSLGEIRIRREGGSGTHRGIYSIIQEIETQKFPRIRVGIGPVLSGQDMTDFVLSPFEPEEVPLLEQSLGRAQEALELILAGQIERAMNGYN